ncbi:quinone oxidoreductase [Lecanora helva]
MSLPSESRQWILHNKPTDMPELEGPNATFKLETKAIPKLKENQLLVKTLSLSNDPAQRGWISKNANPERLYVPPVPQDAVMRAAAIAEVVQSNSDDFKAGDIVRGQTGWADYAVVEAKDTQVIEKLPGLSYSHYLGAFGLTGLTAYYGTKIVANAGPDDTVVVSGAAGATGSIVVQLAKKFIGCKKVIGIAGNDEKCKWVESLGADICLNYKASDFRKQLRAATEGYVEVYFDNVGGSMLDLMFTRMKRHGRIAACGAVADYNKSDWTGLKNWFEVISNRIEIKGFIIFDFLATGKGPEAVGELVQAWKEGKLQVSEANETVVKTKFEDVPKTWMSIFEGANQGKLISKLAW